MLSSDVGLDPSLPWDPLVDGTPGVVAPSTSDPSWESGAEGESAPADDLVAFAKALTAAGVKLYTAVWCPACNEQRALFEDGADFLPSIEVTNPNRTLNAVGIAENITSFPTWEFPDHTRETGVLSLATLSARAGVAIPTSVNPFIAPIPDTTLYSGSPLHIGLDGYDPNGGPLTYTVVSSNPSLVTASILTGSRSARITVQGWGDMVFYLFESEVPRATGRFITLAQSGFYDAANNDPSITVHRVIDDFMMQFGDPTGTGAGGSSLGNFDDHFHPDLQHNTAGALSWAKAGDDTNNSQVFITDVPTRYLDFNHSYFGQLVEGNYTRDGITATATDSSNRPTVPINIQSVTIFQDIENGMLRLKALEGAAGEADITVTVTDSDGHQYVEVFHVTVTPDPYNGGPYLADIPPISTTTNTPATFALSAIDVEGDPVVFSGVKQGTVNYSFSVDAQTGVVTVTPPVGYVGTMELLVRVRAAGATDTADTYDSQRVSIAVLPAAPSAVDLVAASDSGYSSTDDLTRLSDLTFDIVGVASGAQVRLYHGSTLLGQATASGATVSITTSGLASFADGTYAVHATQVVNGLESEASTPLNVTLDRTPPGDFTSTPPTTATVGVQLTYDAQNPEEGATGATYTLINAPAGASITPATGVLTWTPTGTQLGLQSFAIVMTDAAGNTRQQDLSVEVSSDVMVVFRLEVTDTSGTPITSVDVGDEFLLKVYVQDLRDEPHGVFGAFLDVVYNGLLVSVNGVLQFNETAYPNGQAGSLATAGLIDEAGALSNLKRLGGGEFLVWSLPMKAIGAGIATFTADPADVLPDHDVLLYDLDQAVSSDDIGYGSITLTIHPPFDVNPDTFTVVEDSPATSLDVLANDAFHPGSTGSLTITAVGTPSQGGTVTIAADGKTVLYTPAPDFFGIETFTYTASDGSGEKSAIVTVTVTGTNDDPTAVDDTFVVAEDAVNVVLRVLDNDLIAPDTGETLQVVSVGIPSAGGSVTISAARDSVLYTPAENFYGIETFTYTITDGHGGTSTATVTVTVTEVNDPPLATNDVFTVMEDSVGNTLDVLANDSTQGDEQETLTIVSTTTPNRGGTVTIAEDKLSLIYTPAADFFGTELFQYTISDGHGGTAQASVTVIVTGTNDPPTANDDTATAFKNGPATLIDVLANDSSAPDENETLTIIAVGTPSAGGTVAIVQNGTKIQYTPPANYSGTETFTYTITDPGGATATATVTVTVSEYIPSSLSGYAYIDVNNNGVKEAVETPLCGIIMTLSGVSSTGAAVNMTATTDARGYYEFTQLAPGTYKIRQTQPEFLIDGIVSGGALGTATAANELTVVLAQNVNGQNLNFGERGRKAAYISIFDFCASTPRDSVLATANPAGTGQWYAIQRGWSQAQTLALQLQANQTSAKLLASTASSSSTHSTMLDFLDPRQVQRLGVSGATQLVRIVAAPSVLFPNVMCATCGPAHGEAEGEGESVTTVLMAATPADAYRATELLMAQSEAAQDGGFGGEPWLDYLRPDGHDYAETLDSILAEQEADSLLD